jgi:hypothetical protein
LLAAYVGAPARHHDRRIPPEHRHGAAEGMEALPFLFELLVGTEGHEPNFDVLGGGRIDGRQFTSQPGERRRKCLITSFRSIIYVRRLRLTARLQDRLC